MSSKCYEIYDDGALGLQHVVLNGVSYYRLDADTEKAKSEAIVEQAEELELLKEELRAYRSALSHMTEYAQLSAALVVSGVECDAARKRILSAFRKIKEIL